MKMQDSVSWNIILHGLLDQDAFEEGLQLYTQARRIGFDPNTSTLLLLIQAYRSLRAFDEGLKFHGYLIRGGLWSLKSVQNSLLCMYTEIGMEYAENLFEELYEKDVISWSVMIRGYVHHDEILFALNSFNKMATDVGIEADGQTMVSILKGCTNLGDIRLGKSFHGFSLLRGLNYDLFVGNALVDFYCNCTDVASAIRVFSEMYHKNLVTWNSLLCGFVHNEMYPEAFTLFSSMEKSGFVADEVTLVNLIQSCKVVGVLRQCNLIHSKVIQQGFQSNEFAMNSLIDAYGKCNQINYACKVFCQIKRPDVVTWGTMISGFTHCGMPDEAVSVYREMRASVDKSSPVTLLNLIEACALSAELRISNWAHGIAITMGLASHVVLGTAILDMYSKCGAIVECRRVFDQISMKNVVSWSAIISAYGLNGLPRDALSLLSEMKASGFKPNSVTTLSVLSACCHGGLVDEGLSIFNDLANNGAEMKLEHYSCLVDLLARSGHLVDALDIIKHIPVGMNPSASAWGALLSACRNYEDSEFTDRALSQILELEPTSTAGYLLASNIYAARGSWVDAFGMRSLVKRRGIKVVPGFSLVHASNNAYRFAAGDLNHPLSHMLCPVIEQLHLCMKKEVRATTFVS
ncbi:pentatricopeptide repeat-containing protein [Dorcoceras hygrometricum]|uniref:Pentatricopeptide repeat-containing protein n=1 Tax=Dorcoceras hygrometricum TaxID=472368 RepID=A0A2Z7CMY5_9LAMI|nr:pentatricopeptide repeat-containing protein [Dorcoceras hygrometricum]